MKLQAAQVQKLALTQSMRQSLTFLQLLAVDLSQAVQEAALSNPLLEVTEPDFGRVAVDVARPEEDPAPVFQESELWPRYAPRGGEEAPPVPERAESFAEYLEGQLGTIPYLDARLRELCRYLIGCLNSAGYLDCPLTELAEELGVPLFEMEQALLAIQTLDPPGVGARETSPSACCCSWPRGSILPRRISTCCAPACPFWRRRTGTVWPACWGSPGSGPSGTPR